MSRSGQLNIAVSVIPSFKYDPMIAPSFKPLDGKFDPTIHGSRIDVYRDVESTPSSLFTSTKTTKRVLYDHARERAGIQPFGTPGAPAILPDVLLYNEDNNVTESSICNVAFYHQGQWITPHPSTGCYTGVMRRWLLEQKYIVEAEEPFRREAIKEGDWILLFNGVQGCRLGRIL